MVVIQISLVVLVGSPLLLLFMALTFIQGIVLSAFTNFGLLYGNSTWEGKEAQWRIPIARM
jgi:hypothetical protein